MLSKLAPIFEVPRLARVAGCALIATACLLWALPLPARAEASPDAALTQLLAAAHAEATPSKCAERGIDRLVRIMCSGHIRIGVRDEYPLFATHTGATWQGYEIDIARAVGQKLGVAVDFVSVKAATRVPVVASGGVDLVIATMGDNTQRETQVRFIRPHYYRSETMIIGPRDLTVADWADIRDRTVCGTVGNGSNAELVSRGARLMLFDDAAVLPERLQDQTCTLVAQDDSFFDHYFTSADFASQFSEKFGFAPVPWGMGVARQGSEQLARALDLMSQVFHRDGVFLTAARGNRVGTKFLIEQQAVWARPECNTDSGSTNPSCVLPPANAELQPTPFAGRVAAFEAWFARATGFELDLPMLKTAPAWSLFLNGAVNSIILVAGALASTLIFALVFGFAMGSQSRLVHWPARAVTVALQSSPILLTLVITAAVMHALVPYSPTVAIGAAIVALGLSNGSNAGQAISEAYVTLRADRSLASAHRLDLFLRALHLSATQIVAFLINAAKGTPIASFIGAPELLSALTDITSFSSGRATTYTLLLIFYTAVVIAVVWLCRRCQLAFDRSGAAT